MMGILTLHEYWHFKITFNGQVSAMEIPLTVYEVATSYQTVSFVGDK